MSLTLAINAANTALNANQRSIGILANNIANVNTEGYSRQSIAQSAQVVGNEGSGVFIDSVSRKTDRSLITALRNEQSEYSYEQIISQYQERVQILLGTPGSNGTLTSAIDEYFNIFDDLANNPESASMRAAALTASQDLATSISSTADSMQDLRFEIDQEFGLAVDDVNELLGQIQQLNETIAVQFGNGDVNGAILDQRDIAVLELSSYLNVDVYTQPSGAVYIYTEDGTPLLDLSRHELSYQGYNGVTAIVNGTLPPALTIQPLDEQGDPVGSPKSILTTDENGTINAEFSAGSLLAMASMRDQVLASHLEGFDEIAYAIREAVNAIHNTGSGVPPMDQYTGQRLSEAGEIRDWAGVLQIGVTDVTGEPVASPYPGEEFLPTMNLNLSFDSGEGNSGRHSLQTIMDEINNYYGVPQKRVSIGDLTDIKLVALEENTPADGSIQFDFDLSNLSSDELEIQILDIDVDDDGAGANPPVDVGAAIEGVPYNMDAGQVGRTGADFSFTATGLTAISTISVEVQVTNQQTGDIYTSILTFPVDATQSEIKNNRYIASTGTVDYVETLPTSTQQLLRANLVDANGLNTPGTTTGYLNIETLGNGNYVAINDNTTQDFGLGSDLTTTTQTNKGFGHFFGLNNLFDSFESGLDEVTPTTNFAAGAALNFSVREDIANDANKIAISRLSPIFDNGSSDPDLVFELTSGDNSIARAIADLDKAATAFGQNSLLPATEQTFSSYASSVITTISAQADAAESRLFQAESDFNAFAERVASISGVNIDEELANMLIYQNAFNAAARVISVADELFEILLNV